MRRVWPWVIVAGLLAGPALGQPDEISATESERLRAYAQEIKNDRDQKEAELATLRILLEKARQALMKQYKAIEELKRGGREQ